MIPSSSSRSNWLIPVITAIAIVGAFVVNILSNILPEQNVGEIANTTFREMLVLPASYAFAIWGLIYLGLFAYGIYQFQPLQRQNPNTQRINGWLIAACVSQMIWIVLFTQRLYAVSIVAMAGILLPLIAIYLGLLQRDRPTRAERWCVQVPMRVYLGWISVATIVNVASALFAAGWTGGIAAAVWALIVMGIAAAIALTLLVQYRDSTFPLVIAWALVAIALRHQAEPVVWITAAILAGGLALLSVALPRFRV